MPGNGEGIGQTSITKRVFLKSYCTAGSGFVKAKNSELGIWIGILLNYTKKPYFKGAIADKSATFLNLKLTSAQVLDAEKGVEG